MPFYYDTIYWVLLVPVLVLSLYAQFKVSSSFRKYSRIKNQHRGYFLRPASAMKRRNIQGHPEKRTKKIDKIIGIYNRRE